MIIQRKLMFKNKYCFGWSDTPQFVQLLLDSEGLATVLTVEDRPCAPSCCLSRCRSCQMREKPGAGKGKAVASYEKVVFRGWPGLQPSGRQWSGWGLNFQI